MAPLHAGGNPVRPTNGGPASPKPGAQPALPPNVRRLYVQRDREGSLGFMFSTIRRPPQGVFHFISVVDDNGPAAIATVKLGDRLLRVNEVNVMHATHNEVVELLQKSPPSQPLRLLVTEPNDIIRAALAKYARSGSPLPSRMPSPAPAGSPLGQVPMASPLGRSHTANTMASSSSLMQGFARQVACLITVPECDEPVFLAVQAHPSSGYDVLTHPVSPNDNFEDTVHQALLLQLGATIELRGILRFEVASPTDPVPMVTVVFLVDLPGIVANSGSNYSLPDTSTLHNAKFLDLAGIERLRTEGQKPWRAGHLGLEHARLLEWARYVQEGNTVLPLHFLAVSQDPVYFENSGTVSVMARRETGRRRTAPPAAKPIEAQLQNSRPPHAVSMPLSDQTSPVEIMSPPPTKPARNHHSATAIPLYNPDADEQEEIEAASPMPNRSGKPVSLTLGAVPVKNQSSTDDNGTSPGGAATETSDTVVTPTLTTSTDAKDDKENEEEEDVPLPTSALAVSGGSIRRGGKDANGKRRVVFSDTLEREHETWSARDYERRLDPGDGFADLHALVAHNQERMEAEQEEEVESSVANLRLRAFYILKNGVSSWGFKMKGRKRHDVQMLSEDVLITEIDPEGAIGRDGHLKVGDRIIKLNGQWALSMQHVNYLMEVLNSHEALDVTICRDEPLPRPINLPSFSNAELQDAAFEHYGLRIIVSDMEQGEHVWTREDTMELLATRFEGGQKVKAPAVQLRLDPTTGTMKEVADSEESSSDGPASSQKLTLTKSLSLNGTAPAEATTTDDGDDEETATNSDGGGLEVLHHSVVGGGRNNRQAPAHNEEEQTDDTASAKGRGKDGKRRVTFSTEDPQVADTYPGREYERKLDPGEGFYDLRQLFDFNNQQMEDEQMKEAEEYCDNRRMRTFTLKRPNEKTEFGFKVKPLPRDVTGVFLFLEGVLIDSLSPGSPAWQDGRLSEGDRLVKINGQWVLNHQHSQYLLNDLLAKAVMLDLTIVRGDEALPALPTNLQKASDDQLEALALEHAGRRIKLSAGRIGREELIAIVRRRFASSSQAAMTLGGGHNEEEDDDDGKKGKKKSKGKKNKKKSVADDEEEA